MAKADLRDAFLNYWLTVYHRGYFASNKMEDILGEIYDELVPAAQVQEDVPEPGWKPWCGDSKPPYPNALYTVLRRDGNQRYGAPDEVGSWKHGDDEADDEIVAYSVTGLINKNDDWYIDEDRLWVYSTNGGHVQNAVTVDCAGGSKSTESCLLLAKHLYKLLSGKAVPNQGWKPAQVCLPTKDDEDPFGHVVIKRNEQAKPKFIRSCFVRRELADHPNMQWCPSGLSLPKEKDSVS